MGRFLLALSVVGLSLGMVGCKDSGHLPPDGGGADADGMDVDGADGGDAGGDDGGDQGGDAGDQDDGGQSQASPAHLKLPSAAGRVSSPNFKAQLRVGGPLPAGRASGSGKSVQGGSAVSP